MRILLITPYAEPEKGACTIRVNAFKEYFCSRNFEVKIIAPQRGGVNSVGVERYNGLKEYLKLLMFSDYDLIIGTSPPIFPNFIPLLIAKARGKKFFLDGKEDGYFIIQRKKNLKYYFISYTRRIIYTYADYVFFLTNDDLILETKKYGLKNYILLPNGTEPEKIYFDKNARIKIRKRYSVGLNEKLFLYAGTVGDEDMEGMIKHFSKTNYRVMFILAYAKHDAEKRLTNTIIELAKNMLYKPIFVENIPFEEMKNYLSAADVALCPFSSHLWTSFPVKIFDYIAAGLPVIAKAGKKSAMKEFFKKHPFAGKYFSDWSELMRDLNTVNHKRSKEISLFANKISRRSILKKLDSIIVDKI